MISLNQCQEVKVRQPPFGGKNKISTFVAKTIKSHYEKVVKINFKVELLLPGMPKKITFEKNGHQMQDDLIDPLLRSAVENRASDIHLEPIRSKLQVRFRVDGVLYPFAGLEQYPPDEIVSRIKVLSKLDILEKRMPQDGHLEFGHKEKLYNIRVATSPTIYGEAAVLRILNREDIVIKLENLGLEQEQLETLNRLIANPYGLVLITGPTGSGKTTLLYSILNTFNRQNRNLVTVEDPVEFQMDEVRQIQINEPIGLSYSRAMRLIMRQDPDIIMLGEIRDSETAQMVFQAALAGLLLFSTFHTFDVPGLVIRLLEMGIPRSVVAHALVGVATTRLVRKICPSCAAVYQSSEFERKILGDLNGIEQLKRGQGCQNCRNSGYLGRTGVFEIVSFDDEVRNAIVEGVSAGVLRELFHRKTGKNLWQAGLDKVFSGQTTVEEIVRVIGLPGSESSAGPMGQS